MRGLNGVRQSTGGITGSAGDTVCSRAAVSKVARWRGVVGLLLGLTLIVGAFMPAHADDVEPPPAIPHEFAGTVIVDGVLAVEGTVVEAFVDDIEDATTTVDSESRYVLLVEGPGTTVTFRVAGRLANETAAWQEGGIDDEFNLTVGEAPTVFNLKITSTGGGSVTRPGEGDFTYVKGTVVTLEATRDADYQFVSWTGDVGTVAEVNAHLTTITMQGDYDITANFQGEGSLDPFPFPFPFDCFIATAAYGTPAAEQIDVLREFRGEVLLESATGSQFVALYYRFSPPVADFIAGNGFLRAVVRDLFIDPLVRVLEATGRMWRH